MNRITRAGGGVLLTSLLALLPATAVSGPVPVTDASAYGVTITVADTSKAGTVTLAGTWKPWPE